MWVHLVEILAWPVAVVLIALILRSPLDKAVDAWRASFEDD